MTKQVRETTAGKSISAYVILNPKGVHVATVQSHYSDAGNVSVDVWHQDSTPLQQGRAGGYGYDKFTAALCGLVIDGHKMGDHCGRDGVPKYPKGRASWSSGTKPKRGYSFSNWASGDRTHSDGSRIYPDMAQDESGWRSCYRLEAFKYLEAFDYRIIKAV
jgi:hypothetical protein